MSDDEREPAQLLAAQPTTDKRERKKRERREEVKVTTSLDIARLVDSIGERVNRAFENGGASGRLNYETLSKQLDQEVARHAETQSKLLKALDIIREAAARNAMLEIYQGKRDVEMREVEARAAMGERIVGAAERALPMIAPHIARALNPGAPKPNAEAASAGAKTGEAAFIRLMLKVYENPQVRDLVIEFAGVEDWKLLVLFAQSLGKQDEVRTTAA